MQQIAEPETGTLESREARGGEKLRSLFASVANARLMQVAGRVGVYSFLALLFLREFYVSDPDIWWHLATGKWILQHHTVPMTDPFSSYGLGKPWIAYSWMFDIVAQLSYQAFGYMAFVYFEVLVRAALGVALFHLVYSLLPRFWQAAAITGVSLYAMSWVIGPRPGMLTILFGIIELDILLSVRRTGAVGKLWLLPAMLLIWANWHIQFVYGLLLLAVFACEPLAARLLKLRTTDENLLLVKRTWIVLVASAAATLVNPYGPRVYSTVFQYMHQPKAFSQIIELKAMTFREPANYAVLFLALSAAVAIGWRRDTRLLWPILLSIASFLAFRSVKESWFLAVIAACALADGWEWRSSNDPPRLVLRYRLLTAVWLVAALVAGFRFYGVSRDFLEMQVTASFPETSAQYIEKHNLAGLLYNDFNWGGFLIWRLPQLKVAIDGRTNVHGDERVDHSVRVWTGRPEWATDPELLHANVVVAKKSTALASLLRLDPRFKIVYEDVQAAVFQPR
jgi:hypothetical protein